MTVDDDEDEARVRQLWLEAARHERGLSAAFNCARRGGVAWRRIDASQLLFYHVEELSLDYRLPRRLVQDDEQDLAQPTRDVLAIERDVISRRGRHFLEAHERTIVIAYFEHLLALIVRGLELARRPHRRAGLRSDKARVERLIAKLRSEAKAP